MKHIGYKIALISVIAGLLMTNCKKDDTTTPTKFDYVAQEKIDRDSLESYLSTHYLDTSNNIKKITDGQTPLINQVKTKTVSITNDYSDDEIGEVTIDYKLYYIVTQEGVGVSPIFTDSIHYSYQGLLLDGTTFDRKDRGTWFGLPTLIRGVQESIGYFKSGKFKAKEDQSLTFFNTGQGYLFMPSGLGYGKQISGKIKSNSPLIFKISLNLVKQNVDWDEDGIYSQYEDVNRNGDFTDDNTDGDKYVNFLDDDDDGDGKLTKDEHADPNGDGNPADAKDSDGDGTPDYLDSDS